MPSELINFVIAFARLFSKPVFKRVEVLVVGAILSPVSRTVPNALRGMGLSQEKHFENYHRVRRSGSMEFFARLADIVKPIGQNIRLSGSGGYRV